MKACLLIHGFTGSPFEIEPLAEALRQQGYIVETPVLAGHGHDEDLQDVYWTDWIQSAEDALREMIERYETVYLIGFSMGALISAYLSTKYPVKKLVLLSPAIYCINYKQLFCTMSEAIKKKFAGDKIEGLASELKKYLQKATNTPIRSVIHFRQLAEQLTPSFAYVTAPTLIIQGHKDVIVEPSSATKAYETIQSVDKKLVFLDLSPHIVCHGEESELVNQHVIEFLASGSSA
ncbi:hypothetical protein BHU72_00735 [Desulfuribacillus stibiiarsenatis]|uniref:Serine aminopeptidase S33 domain-containing protein n=1 Tax=Desulfuribacillus stibiiarsenatis TaxID=1390249 RepID=A0A1E5L9M1_9FIRM|nr:alpha/beta fold hydrolase [Desulfuribacillus stibiiarsenatis]OEH86826.1 hypothetical protein BHU72_00735 [Desulfuribacillus stibiiarsenatis]